MPKQIVLYSAPGCSGCEEAKKFFNEHGIPFLERDISTDEDAKSELQRRGYRATPVVVIGEQVMIGFSADRLKRMLQQAA
jgi:glutaredoxin